MSLLDALILGVVQGLTEFLPVSSSGHLVLVQVLLGVQPDGITFEVFAHVGTLLALLVAYRSTVLRLIRGVWALPQLSRGGPRDRETADDLRLLGLLLLASVPAGLAGILLKPQIDRLFGSVELVGWMLLLTGGLLLVAERRARPAAAPVDPQQAARLSAGQALLMGIGQALAILPGLSRSGTTLSFGLLARLDRADAANFAFLMAIPAIGGVFLLTLVDLAQTGSPLEGTLLVGAAAAAVSGYGAIHALLRLVQRGRLWWFTLYTWAVGAWVLLT